MTGHDDYDEMDRLGDELRQQVGGEFRRTAEEDEFVAAKAQMRSRTLEHVAYELLSRGDTIAVTMGPDRILGVVVHAKGDVLCVQTMQGDRVDVHLGGLVAIQVVERSRSAGRTRDTFGADSFVARLRELELDEAPVVLNAPATGEPVEGLIEAVTSDHVMLSDPAAGHWYIPLASIAAVTVR